MSDPTLELNYARWLPDDLDAPILDLGCGNGRVLRFLSEKGYRSVHGVDRDASALRAIGPLDGTSTECAEVGVDYLERHRGRFRMIILKQVVYYLERGEVLPFMEALREALTPDGVVLIECFNATLLSSRFTELKDPFIRTAYTEHGMRRLLAASGFSDMHVIGERSPTKSMKSRAYRVARAAWTAILRTIYILERGYDDEMPRIYTKSFIAVARRQSTADPWTTLP